MTHTRIFALVPPDALPLEPVELVAFPNPPTGGYVVLATGCRVDLEPAHRALVDLSNRATRPELEEMSA